jgi:hypothetical protein
MAASVPVLRILFQKGNNNSTQTKLAMNTERSLNNATSLETLSTRTNDVVKVDGYRENSRLSIAESHIGGCHHFRGQSQRCPECRGSEEYGSLNL